MQASNRAFTEIIKQNPLLTREQEQVLARKAKKGNLKAREKLIQSNYRLAISMAKKYHRPNIDFEDLLQESTAGLIKAVDKFDPELGYKLGTYACWWIKQAILPFINESISDIKVPSHSRMLNSKIKNKINELELKNGKVPSLEEISVELGESVKKIKYTLKANEHIVSLDNTFDSDNSSNRSYVESIKDTSSYADPAINLENKELKEIIYRSLSLLTPKEEKIIRLRFGIGESSENKKNFPVTDEMCEYLNEN